MRAVKAVGFLGALAALMLAGCGDGSIKSPDFDAVTTIESVDVQPVTVGQPNSLPAGTTLSYRVFATYTTTVPPGQANPGPQTKDVTGDASWTSNNDAVATVDKGVVTGKTASATPVTITASFRGLSDSVNVTVTAGILTSVEYVTEVGTARAADDNYSVIAGNSATFQLYGHFSDQVGGAAPLPIDGAAFGVQWMSSDSGVASNVGNSSTFDSQSIGSTTITGTVTHQADGSALAANVTPTSASATLTVSAASAFCESEFLAPAAKTSSEPSPLCFGCGITDPDNVIDGDADTDAAMNIPLGLLGSARIALDVSDNTRTLAVGKRVGLVLSRSADILTAQLLNTLKLETVHCDANGESCETIESFDPTGDVLHLALLGLLGAEPQYLLSSEPLQEAGANGVRLTFGGGGVAALATLHVQSACTSALPPT